MDIESIINAIKEGDINEFETIINLYQQRIFNYCWYMIGNKQEAEDAVQETFIKALFQIEKYKSNTNFQSWLYKITYNQCIDVLRKRKRMLMFQYIGHTVNCEGSIIEETNSDSNPMYEALERLSVGDRNVILLKVLDNKSYEEISTILHKSPEALRKQYERAKNKLRKVLKEEEFNEQLFQCR